MKSLFKTLLPIVAFAGLFLSSCSEDDTPIVNNEDTFTSSSEISDLISRTSSDGSNQDAIDCIDFVYPITFFIYDSNQQQTGSETVNSDEELFIFLSGLDASSAIAIDFPISVVKQDGTIVEVNSNSELVDLITDCVNGGANQVPSDFETILTDGVWFVTYFFDDEDETDDFAGYEFSFNADNSAMADNGSNMVPGIWGLTSGSTPDLILNFGTTDPFEELDEDWDIIFADDDKIELKHISGGNGGIDFLTFERTPNTGGGGSGSTDLITVLTDGEWFVNLLNDDNDDETCDYVEYGFSFNADQTVIAASASNTVNGTWQVTNDSSGLDLVLNFEITGDDDPFDDLNDDWDVLTFDETTIELLDISGGNGGTDFLTFGRMPYTGCSGSNAQDLIDTFIAGPWAVQLFSEDGVDETANYMGYVLTFNADNTVVADNGSNSFNGTWSVTGGSDLDVLLDFGTQIPFDEFNDDWEVDSYTSEVISLFDISGGNGTTDLLVFEKL